MRPKLNYSSKGRGEDIVLLHGWGMHAGVWLGITDKLAESYRVTLFDLPGYGDNRRLVDCQELAAISETILTIIPQPAILLGWSMGGLIAMWLAINYPAIVNKLVLANTTPCFSEQPDWPGIPVEDLGQFKESLATDFYHTMLRFLALQVNMKNRQDAKRQLAWLKAVTFAKTLPAANFLINQLNLLLNTDLRTEIITVRSPVLYLLGESDRLVPVAVKQNLLQYLPQADIKILPDAGHIPFISHPSAFLAIITEFIHAK